MAHRKLFGLNWVGSKGLFADQIIDVLPAADVFVDLFCGGCAVTHAALMSGKYKHVIANDVKDMAAFFKQALEGKVENLLEPISREEFFKRNKTDPKVMSCWSFSGKVESYLWSKGEGELNLELFKAVTDTDWVKRKEHLRHAFNLLVQRYDEGKVDRAAIIRLQKVKLLNVLKRVANLAEFSHLSPMLETSRKDYRNVEIPAGAVVYADIPYINCQTYNEGKFDHEAFYEWWRTRPYPVFVSEYKAPEEFSCVWHTTRRVTSGLEHKQAEERLFVQTRYAGAFMKGEAQHELFVNSEQLEASA